MRALYASSIFRHVIALIVFCLAVGVYAFLAIGTLLRSEQVYLPGQRFEWGLVEKVIAFPAFYIGADPLTGLIINAATWGLVATMTLFIVWPQRKS